MDRYVRDEAAAQVVRWQQFGRTIPASVNVSTIDMFDHDLANELSGLMQTHNISADDCILEITESTYTDNSQQIINSVK